MKITNRTGRKVFWRTFSAADGLKIAGLKSGSLESGLSVSRGMGQGQVQIEFKEYANGLGVFAYSGQIIHGASKSELYSNKGWVVLADTGKPVSIDTELKELMNPGSVHKEGEEEGKSQTEVRLEEFLAMTTALVDGLIAGFAKSSVFLGSSKAGVGLAGVILSVLDDSPEPQFPDLQQISDALERVLVEHEAKTQRSHILAAARWFDKYVRKSAALAQGKDLSETSIDLSPFDREHFEDELNDILDGHTEFRGTLNVLEANRQIRRFVIAEYILGFSLWLHLERIQLLLKQETQPLDVHDIEAVERQIERFDQTLQESEEDFIELRNEIFRRHPLISPQGIIDPGRNPNEVAIYARPQPEVEQIVKGINLKYLKGDRWLIRSTRHGLKNVLEQLGHLPVSA